MTPSSRSGYLLLPLAVLSLGASDTAYSATVNANLNVAPAVTWTDNVCLTDSNKKDDWVARVTPGGNISIRGKRANLNIGGSVEVNSLSNSQLENAGCSGGQVDRREQYRPNLRANGSAKLIRNHLTLAYSARAGYNTFNSRLAGIEDRFDTTGNVNNYYRYVLSPMFTTRVGRRADLKVGYGYDVLLNEKNKANDSILQSATLSLNSRGASQISWGLTGNHREIEYTNDDPGVLQRRKTDRQSARALLGYRFGSRLSINGTYGYDFNNLKTNNKYDQNGNAWSINLRWTPNRRTSVTVGSGDRFFGKTPTLQVRYRRQRNSFTLGFDKRIRYDRDIRTQSGGELDDFGINQSLQSRDPIIDERWNLGYTFDGHNIDVSVRGSHSVQTRTLDDTEGTFLNLSVSATPVISSRFSISYFVNWYQDQPEARFGRDDRDDSDTWSVGASYNRPLSKKLNFSLTYQFTDRSSNQDFGFGNYQENRIEARLAIAL